MDGKQPLPDFAQLVEARPLLMGLLGSKPHPPSAGPPPEAPMVLPASWPSLGRARRRAGGRRPPVLQLQARPGALSGQVPSISP